MRDPQNIKLIAFNYMVGPTNMERCGTIWNEGIFPEDTDIIDEYTLEESEHVHDIILGVCDNRTDYIVVVTN